MNLITKCDLIAIRELRTIRHHAFSKTKSEKANMDVAVTKPTHYVWFAAERWSNERNFDLLTIPNMTPAVLFHFDGKTTKIREVFGRKGRSKGLLCGKAVYYILTYYDVSGTNPPGGRDLRYFREGTMQYLLKKGTKKQYEKAMEEISAEISAIFH